MYNQMNTGWLAITKDMIYGVEDFQGYFIKFNYERISNTDEFIFDGLLHFEKEGKFSRHLIRESNIFIEQKNISGYDDIFKRRLLKDIKENKYTFIINFDDDNLYPKVYIYSLQDQS